MEKGESTSNLVSWHSSFLGCKSMYVKYWLDHGHIRPDGREVPFRSFHGAVRAVVLG